MGIVSRARQRLVTHYAEVLEDIERSGDEAAVARLDREWDQIREGQARAADYYPELAHRFAATGMTVLGRRQPPSVLLGWVAAALPFAEASGDSLALAAQINRRGALNYTAGRYATARDDFGAAAALMQDTLSDPGSSREEHLVSLAGYHRNAAAAGHALGDTVSAVASTQRALAMIEGRGHVVDESALLGNLGTYADECGDHTAAVGYYERALALARPVGDLAHIAKWSGNLGNTSIELGRVDEARSSLRESLAAASRLGDRGQESLRLGNLARLEWQTGSLDSATELHHRALTIAKEMGERRIEAVQHQGLAQIEFSAGRWSASEEAFTRAYAIFDDIGDIRARTASAAGLRNVAIAKVQAEARAALARICEGAVADGTNRLAGLIDTARAASPAAESLVVGYLAFAAFVDGRPGDALGHYETAMQLDERSGHIVLTAEHLRGAGLVHHAQGNLVTAFAAYTGAAGLLAQVDIGSDDGGERRALALQLADLGSTWAGRGDVHPAVRAQLMATGLLTTVDAPETTSVRGRLASLLTPVDPASLQEFLHAVDGRRDEVAGLSALLLGGELTPASERLFIAGDPLRLVLIDDSGVRHDVEPAGVAGVAALGPDGHVLGACGLHPG